MQQLILLKNTIYDEGISFVMNLVIEGQSENPVGMLNLYS